MRSGGWTAVVTAAGSATRFRPFSSVIPKEMLPVGGRPAIEHVIRECVAAGASEVLAVTRPDDDIVPCYLNMLRAEGLPADSMPEDLSHGYGNAAPLATLRSKLESRDLFAVAFGDDLLLGGDDLARMLEIAMDGAEAVIAAQTVSRADISSFGVVDTVAGKPDRVAGIRQRPEPDTVGEPLALVSRLILRPSIFDLLVPAAEARGELDLGVAVGRLAHIADVRVHCISGTWITVGDPRRYARALTAYWQHQMNPHSEGEN
jgi:UTP--glucose-1-phosphate uridylyltransferase